MKSDGHNNLNSTSTAIDDDDVDIVNERTKLLLTTSIPVPTKPASVSFVARRSASETIQPNNILMLFKSKSSTSMSEDADDRDTKQKTRRINCDIEDQANSDDSVMNTKDETDSILLPLDHPNYCNNSFSSAEDSGNNPSIMIQLWTDGPYIEIPSLRRIALHVSLYVNIIITITKLIAYIRTLSLSVLAALLDSVLDVVSQAVLNYTEKHSSLQRSSAFYPAGASRLEPIGVLTCAALMGMTSFEVLKESIVSLITQENNLGNDLKNISISFWSMTSIVFVKLFLLWICNVGAHKKQITTTTTSNQNNAINENKLTDTTDTDNYQNDENNNTKHEKFFLTEAATTTTTTQQVISDPTLEALAQDHWNDCLSNGVAAIALLFIYRNPNFWYLDPIGAIIISLYIIYSWYCTGKEQIEQLTGKSAPAEFIDEVRDLVVQFDPSGKIIVDVIRAYHFGPKFLVEIEIVLPKQTNLIESHDIGMELQYEIEALCEVERCFVHIDYETRPYDEHVVSKVPALREKYRPSASGEILKLRSASSV